MLRNHLGIAFRNLARHKLYSLINLFGLAGSFYLMRAFFQEFPFRVTMGVGTFLLGGGLALALAFLTTIFQAVRAAAANPVDSLRYE